MWFFHKGFNLINVFSRQRFEQLKEHKEAGRDTTSGCMVERNTSTMKRERDLNIEDPTSNDPSGLESQTVDAESKDVLAAICLHFKFPKSGQTLR